MRQLRNLWNEEKRHFLFLYAFLILVNAPLIFLRLTNQYDGLWNQDDYMAGSWELSNGRWFWPYLDHARFGVSLDPLPNLVASAGFAATAVLLVRVLSVPWRIQTYLAMMLFLASTGITCQLSFSYMSITFAMSAFLSVLGVFLIVCAMKQERTPDRWKWIAGSGIVIGFMMGCYQASLGITCLSALAVFLRTLSGGNKEKRTQAFHFAGAMLAALMVGGAVYLSGLRLHEWVFQVEPADYQGFSELSPCYLLQHLPEGIAHVYYTFWTTFLDGTFLIFRGQDGFLMRGLYCLGAFFLIAFVIHVMRRNVWNGLWAIAGIFIIPVFANSFYLFAPESECHMQMIVPMTLVMPLVVLLCTEEELNERRAVFLKKLVSLWCAICIWLAALMSLTDEYAMYAGRRATEMIAGEMLKAMNLQGYDYLSGSVMILGNAANSSLFSSSELYWKANAYAQYGNWTDEEGFDNQTWEKVYSNDLRILVSFAASDTRETIADLPELDAMPVFPAAGSVQNLYGVEVIKLEP